MLWLTSLLGGIKGLDNLISLFEKVLDVIIIVKGIIRERGRRFGCSASTLHHSRQSAATGGGWCCQLIG